MAWSTCRPTSSTWAAAGSPCTMCLAHVHTAIEVSGDDDYLLGLAWRLRLVDCAGGTEPPRTARGGLRDAERRRAHAAAFERLRRTCRGGPRGRGIVPVRRVCVVTCALALAVVLPGPGPNPRPLSVGSVGGRAAVGPDGGPRRGRSVRRPGKGSWS